MISYKKLLLYIPRHIYMHVPRAMCISVLFKLLKLNEHMNRKKLLKTCGSFVNFTYHYTYGYIPYHILSVRVHYYCLLIHLLSKK